MRQSMYKTYEIHEMLTSIKSWCQEGATLAIIADRLHVGTTTIHNWREKHPEFAKAITDGFNITEKKKDIRRSKYETQQINEILPGIQGWCREGSTYEEIAEMLHVDRATIFRWRKKYPEFAKAIRDGYMISNGALLNSAFKQAVGYKEQVTETRKVKKQRYDPDSKKVLTEEKLETVTYEKTIKPNDRMTRFMLAKRLPEKFGPQKPPEPDNNFEVIFKGMTDEEVAKLMV